MEGDVKWFNRSKGYGFVAGEDGNEYFVHASQLEEGTFIRENDRVEFEPAETDKGKQAQNIKLLQKGSERSDVSQEETASEESGAEEPSEDSESFGDEAESPAEDSEDFGEEENKE